MASAKKNWTANCAAISNNHRTGTAGNKILITDNTAEAYMNKAIVTLVILISLILFSHADILAAPEENMPPKSKCQVCGMFVNSYPEWVVQLRHQDNSVVYFDGVKDMFVYYFNTRKLSGKPQESISEIWVKDYYYLKWIPARKAYFVIGSTVTGPMGHEFIPHASDKAAKAFLKDYKGKEIITFDQVTEKMVESMRVGSKMR